MKKLVFMLMKQEGTIKMKNMIKTEKSVLALFLNKKAKNIKIEYSSENTAACFDVKWTAEALFNITDNAVKYCPENSTIKISAEPYEMFVCITVEDNGPGIPEDEQHLILEGSTAAKQ